MSMHRYQKRGCYNFTVEPDKAGNTQEVVPDLNTQVDKPLHENQAKVPEVTEPHKPTVKLDHYQTKSEVIVTIFLKNQTQEDLDVDFSKTNIRIRAKLPDGSDYEKEIHLANTINPGLSNFKVMSTKVEIKLRKMAEGSWLSLEAVQGKDDSGLVYPTSSKKRATDWDKLGKEVDDEEIENTDDYKDALFKELYAAGDDDTKKAMIKSMQESHGTQFNMSWEEVKNKRLEIIPRDEPEFGDFD